MTSLCGCYLDGNPTVTLSLFYTITEHWSFFYLWNTEDGLLLRSDIFPSILSSDNRCHYYLMNFWLESNRSKTRAMDLAFSSTFLLLFLICWLDFFNLNKSLHLLWKIWQEKRNLNFNYKIYGQKVGKYVTIYSTAWWYKLIFFQSHWFPIANSHNLRGL